MPEPFDNPLIQLEAKGTVCPDRYDLLSPSRKYPFVSINSRTSTVAERCPLGPKTAGIYDASEETQPLNCQYI